MSRLLEDGTDARLPVTERGRPDSRITTVAAFWMATVGGAEVLGLPIGLIEPGRQFDAIAVDTKRGLGALRVWDDLDDDTRILEKIVNLASPSDITHVWVEGKRV
jgi:guanine deaminase